MIRAVVLDLGGVLASGEGVTSEPAKLLGVPEEEFAQHYWDLRTDYDAGASDSEYWTPILTAVGKPAAVETIQQLAKLDADLWLRLRPAARRTVADLRAEGITTAVLTNAPFNLDAGLLNADFADEVDYWFISAAMGVGKPDKAAFARVTEVLELAPAEIAFVDDKLHNVEAAERFGWLAHQWTSDATTREWLANQGLLDASA
ncbi:MAG TPA: HAD-IA family hydrolase [Propionibacterium sp.]|nr:HAD-IA family hydrolase [Propionibacterium sp.]